MAVHAYHEKLPNYHPDQIWFDGCAECEERGHVVYRGISQLDHNNFARAWARAIEWNTTGLTNVSHAERELLETLWAVHLHQETARRLSDMGGVFYE